MSQKRGITKELGRKRVEQTGQREEGNGNRRNNGEDGGRKLKDQS